MQEIARIKYLSRLLKVCTTQSGTRHFSRLAWLIILRLKLSIFGRTKWHVAKTPNSSAEEGHKKSTEIRIEIRSEENTDNTDWQSETYRGQPCHPTVAYRNKKLSHRRNSRRCGWCETTVQGHSRSSVVMPINAAYVTFC